MTIATITALPTVPATNDSGFEAAANALFTAIKDVMIGEINTMIGQINVYDFGLNMNIGNIVGLTAGRIPFGTGTGALSSSANLFWDASNARLGLGTASPETVLHITQPDDNSGITISHASRAGVWSLEHSGLTSENFLLRQHNGTSWGVSYLAGRDQHTWYTNNTARMTMVTNGNVGIGTESPSTTLHVNGPARVGSYTVATVPSASTAGAGSIIYVTDDVGGAVLAFSDGSNWLRVTDRATVSTT